MCEAGFLCAPNVLCRTCGNICMSTVVIDKLVKYYDSGCSCVPTFFSPLGSSPIKNFGRNLKPVQSEFKIVNGVVQFPGVY